MLRQINFYSICFAFGLSVLLILAGSRYTDNTIYRPSPETRRNIKNVYKIYDAEDNFFQPIPTNPFDGSPDIDKIFENTRMKIKIALKSYNFTYSGAQKLKDLVMEEGGEPLRNLIISTWRSGTTFLGEILNAMPGNFYHYEPLLKYDIIQIRGSPLASKALTDIKNMLKCNFDYMDEYFEYGKAHKHQFSHNTRLWDHCKYKKDLCYDSDFTSKFCKIFPFQSMKIVRLRLKLVEELIADKQLNVKVMLLIRDPRGVMQSRQHRDFCQPAPDCWKPDLLCADMISDYVAASRLMQRYPGKVMVLRYEELALSPNSTTQELLKFLQLYPLPAIDDFLHSHTNTVMGGVSSTFRVSRDVPFKWKDVLDFNYVENIQIVCKEAMDLWGYRMAYNASHMTSKDFYPLDKYTIEKVSL